MVKIDGILGNFKVAWINFLGRGSNLFEFEMQDMDVVVISQFRWLSQSGSFRFTVSATVGVPDFVNPIKIHFRLIIVNKHCSVY